MTKARNWKKAAWVTFFVLPGAAIVFVFILMPLFMSLFNSFFSWNQLIRGEFIGLENFEKLFTGYPYQERFANALGNNVKWFVVTMLVQNTLGILFGYVLSRGIAGRIPRPALLHLPQNGRDKQRQGSEPCARNDRTQHVHLRIAHCDRFPYRLLTDST